VNNKFFTKAEENLCAKQLEGGPKKVGDPRQVPRSSPLKHTTEGIPAVLVSLFYDLNVLVEPFFVLFTYNRSPKFERKQSKRLKR